MTTILNLGCGTRTSPLTTNIDFSPVLRMRSSTAGRLAAKVLVRGYRRDAFDQLSGDLVVHDLRKGIPADDASVDAVYHSHTFEHIDRDAANDFLREVLRVLVPRGIQRIVVPDVELLAREYLDSLDRSDPEHDEALVPMLAQSVQREAHGTSLQRPARRWIENRVLGDARRRGQTHQWMYDRLNLSQALLRAGFVDPQQCDAGTSAIPGWQAINLDLLEDGTPYKPGSLYMEARKPG